MRAAARQYHFVVHACAGPLRPRVKQDAWDCMTCGETFNGLQVHLWKKDLK